MTAFPIPESRTVSANVGGHERTIEIWAYIDHENRTADVGLNWSALGTVSIGTAAQYADLLRIATERAWNWARDLQDEGYTVPVSSASPASAEGRM